jgi:hypothetical protein
VPAYTERGLFLMALAFVLLVLFNSDLRNGIENIMIKLRGREFLWFSPIFVLFISGTILSIYHAFSSKPKTEMEKTMMLVFALGINGITGVIAGLRILNNYNGLLIVFPALNILSSVVLLYLIGFVDTSIIDDKDVSLWELLLGAIIIFITFYLCQFRFDLHWSATFSICLAYAMSIDDILGRLFIRGFAYRRNVINRNTLL